jgi:UDP-N-acetylglucosamine 1-carboxyvinyltransferase
LGCIVTEDTDTYTFEAPNGIAGGELFFRVVSVTATETFMIAAVKAQATVTLKNCAMEPEVIALAEFLKKAGARITGAGTPTITIQPSHVEPPAEPFRVISDRIEAGSFLILGALVGKKIEVQNCDPDHLEALTETLKDMGVHVFIAQNSITILPADKLKPIDIRTHEYPGFPTDLQAPFTVLLTQADGESSVLETIFDGRLNYASELVRMGANVNVVNPHKAIIKGATSLKARNIDGPDIRAGLAFLLAAAVADGESIIGNAHLIDRGYERIEEKLKSLGLSIERVTT